MFKVNLSAEVTGTAKVGELRATLAELSAAFGAPLEGDGDKISAEWRFDGPSGTMTLHDWKQRPWPVYAPKRRIVWTIGGKDSSTVEAFVAWVEAEIARAKPAKPARKPRDPRAPFVVEPDLEPLRLLAADQAGLLVERLATLDKMIAQHRGGRDAGGYSREDLVRVQSRTREFADALAAAIGGPEEQLRAVLKDRTF